MKNTLLLLACFTSLTAHSTQLPHHWVCGAYKPNTNEPIMRIDHDQKTDTLLITLDKDWQKDFGTLPKGKYLTPSHPNSSGMSRYVRMDVTRHFPHPTKPDLSAFLTFTLSYTASAFISEIYVLWHDPSDPSSGNLLAEFLCEAF